MDSVLNKLVKMCCDKNLQTWFAVLKTNILSVVHLVKLRGKS